MSIESELRKFLPPERCLSSTEEMKPYECDGLSAYQQVPLIVVIPATVDEVVKIVRRCADLSIPLVTRGSGTGLSGGALPLSDGCLMSLAKMNKILSVDTENLTATMEPGVRNAAISDAVSDYALYYAPDPSSQIACSIGGNVAENSGGLHCLKYGLTVHNVLEIKVVTIDGEILTIGSRAPDTPALDLLALMHGSEGLLAVIVEITVKLLPKPEQARVLLASFDSVDSASSAVELIISAGVIPAGLEMMDQLSVEVAEDYSKAGYPLGCAAILLCELDGIEAEVTAEINRVSGLMNSAGATQLRVSKTEAERLLLWKGRKSAFPALGRIAPDYYCMDGTIPRRYLGFVLNRIHELSLTYGLRVANVFHAGDGNLHPLIAYDANIDTQLESAEKLGTEILALCVEVGGTITGEHGVGIEKLDGMCIQFSDKEINQMHLIKKAFDPTNLLNPGKAIPSLHRCAELGGMHIHNGQVPHPEIERF
jgi:glycolate oxidase